jgi:uracil phosphoribosyltransferase
MRTNTHSDATVCAPGDLSVRVVVPPAVASLGRGRDDATGWPTARLDDPPGRLPRWTLDACDPKPPTGGSLSEGCRPLRSRGTDRTTVIRARASAPGLERFCRGRPGISVTCAAADPVRDGEGSVVLGLGDAGDRLSGSEAT